jgi:hypothetical protein
MNIYFYFFKNEIKLFNDLILKAILKTKPVIIYNIKDFKNNNLINNLLTLNIFKYNINFFFIIIYKIRSKVMFLINNILYIKSIINGFFNIIINIFKNKNIKVIFLTKNKIKIRIKFKNLFIIINDIIINIYIIILIL